MVKGGAYDSRLLTTLIKADKEVHDSFKQYTQVCENANNALNGWAAADTGDSPDVLTASNRVCELFDEAFEAQKTYLIGLNNYRASLKDVAAREAEIRVIMRDRDIFVSRLVKLNGKKTPTSESAFEAHSGKLEEARAELAACESTLKSEERALVGVKRRIFREALRMRMRAMAQLADAWRDTAERSVEILDSLDSDNNGSMTDLRAASQQQAQPPPPTHIHGTPHSQRHSRNFDMTSPEGSVIAPSHSASQVAARRHGGGFADEYSDDGEGNTILNDGRRPSQQSIPEQDERGGSSEEEGDDGLDPKRYQVHVNKPLTPAELAASKRQSSAVSPLGGTSNMVSNGPVQPAPVQQGQPRAAAPGTLTSSAGAGGGLSNGIRKRVASAPTQHPATESAAARSARESAEERQKRFSTLGTADAPTPAIALPSASAYTVEAHKKRTAPEATLFLPSSNTKTKSYRALHADSDEEEEEEAVAEERDEVRSLDKKRNSSFGGFGKSSHRRKGSDDTDSVVAGRRVLQKRNSSYQESDTGASTVRGGSKHEKSRSEGNKSGGGGGGGLFGSLGSLFKKRDVSQIGGREDEDSNKKGWSTRTESNVGKVGGSKKGKKGGRADDSDSDAPDPRSLVRVVNTGNKDRGPNRVSAFSDVGVSRSGTMRSSRTLSSYNNNNADTTWVPPPERERLRAMSDVGGSKPSSMAAKRKSTTGLDRKSSIKSTATYATADTSVPTMKKKKKVASSIVGTGTAGSAPAATLAPPPTLTTSSRQSSYDAGALVSNLVTMQGKGQVNRTIAQNPAQRVTRDTPSLMSVVAPASQGASYGGMHMPSAKNPGLSRSNSMVSPTGLGTLPLPSSSASNVGGGSEVGMVDAPLKKKKTVKRSSTVGNVAGAAAAAPPSALKSSATTPSLVSRPRPPASILSDGSGVGRRKSVRLASDTRLNEAKYENAGGPANIERSASPNALGNGQPQGILRDSGSAPATNGNGEAYGGEWGTRIGRDGDVSSDEEGDEYAKVRAQLNRSEKDLKGAGFLDKGKGRAKVQ